MKLLDPPLLLLFFFLVVFCFPFSFVSSASCSSSEYCPLGWSVKRRDDRSAMTCEASDRKRKCPKPFMCVRSHCDISFCCANQKIIDRMKRAEEDAENAESDDEL